MRLTRLVPIVLLTLTSLSLTTNAERVKFDLPAGPGRDLVYGHCQTCHDLQSVVDSAGIRKGAWDAVLDNMKGFGLRITEDQRARILDYLGSYMGPNPPPTDGSSETVTAAEVSGKDVFNNTCIACHMEDGKGKPGEFPPLAGNTDLFLSPEFPALVVLNGIEGPLSVEGHDFNNVMPSFDFLSDSEIAAVLTYVRSNWGNDTLPGASTDQLTSDDIKAIRSKPMTATAVHEARAKLLK